MSHDVADLLAEPESKTLEFKRDLSSLGPIMKTVVAFANTAGGTLVIGRDPSGELCGVGDIYHQEERLANSIASTIHPPILPEIEIATIEGKDLFIVRVAHWRGPFYIKRLGMPAGAYMRLGSTSRPAGPELLAGLERSIANVSYDQEALPELSMNDLDLGPLEQALGRSLDPPQLESMGVFVRAAQGLVPSIGGLILFGTEQVRARIVPDARVSCARFQGTDRSHFVDRFEVEGSIVAAVDQVPKFIARNTRLAAQITGMVRKDIPEYPVVAVREALVNALAHTDYSLVGSRIHIAIYSDRLEIQNPGMLPFGFTLRDFRTGVSKLRNRVIARVFRELGYVEEWGSGYKRIGDACRKEGYPEPEWQELSSTMRVIFQPHPSTHAPVARRETGRPTERREAILQLLAEHGQCSVAELHSHMEVSTRVLRADLAHLKKEGLVILEGHGRSAMWQLKS